MRVVFLDVDGVLNSHEYLNTLNIEWFSTDSRTFDPNTIRRVNRLADAGAKFVLTSSWRGTDGFVDALVKAGFRGELIGETPRIGRPRGLEIHAWLRQNPSVRRYVILDDDADMAHLKRRLIKTSFFQGGLLDEHVNLALEMLGLSR